MKKKTHYQRIVLATSMLCITSCRTKQSVRESYIPLKNDFPSNNNIDQAKNLALQKSDIQKMIQLRKELEETAKVINAKN